MHALHFVSFCVLLVSLATFCTADFVVQLNVNRPFNDVNEKFISFMMKPEDLYQALDGSHRKEMTRMASLLDNSYIKFMDDFNFGSNAEQPLRNSNRVIWRGFNRWTKAVNWTMIAPVPYKPNVWNPLQTLKILNQSHLVGISDCIWQLGTDFGSSHAADYVGDLKTMDLMVDSFRPYVDEWHIMGADVSVGSSAEETRRYIELSKDLNTAFGWTQPVDMIPATSMGSYIYENDPALQMLLKKKVPVWLSLPDMPRNKRNKKTQDNQLVGDETTDALRWAQTLGDAASLGFDAIFKRIHRGDWEQPDFSFFVTAFFKKVMGSRVFPARPLNIFSPSNKLYTHCANDVSGGLAFMVVNSAEEPIQITVRSLTKLPLTNVRQYSLTLKKGSVLLNNAKLALNTTFRPEIKKLTANKPIQLSAPAMSVSFWILPGVDLEHCQYTEVETEDFDSVPAETVEEKQENSGDRLLRELIYESSLQHSPIARATHRKRRSAPVADRVRRFVLEDTSIEKPMLGGLLKNIGVDEKVLTKRENPQGERRSAALEWFKQFISNPLGEARDLPLLKRHARNADDFFGSSLFNKQPKRTAITKKIFDIKKPERDSKPLFDLDDFDEEEFFRKINDHTEPAYVRLPEGDVHLKHIATRDGEDIDEEREESDRYLKQKKTQRGHKESEEIVSEMKPLRLLPTEFYEALPVHAMQPKDKKLNTGVKLNALLFPEPFSKKDSKNKAKHLAKSFNDHVDEDTNVEHFEPPKTGAARKQNSSHKQQQQQHKQSKQLQQQQQQHEHEQQENDAKTIFASDFIRAQRELSKAFPNDFGRIDSTEDVDGKNSHDANNADDAYEDDADTATKNDSTDVSLEQEKKFKKYFGKNFDHFLGLMNTQAINKAIENQDDKSKSASEEKPWWELSSLRKKRALRWNASNEAITTNMINKNNEYIPLGAAVIPDHMATPYKYEVVPNPDQTTQQQNNENAVDTLPRKLVSSVKAKVTALVTILTRQFSNFYHTFTNDVVETSTMANTIN